MIKQDYTINGVCPEDCGKCCTNVLPLSLYEINKIKKYIKRNNIQPHNPNIDINNPKYIDECPFLKEDNKCAIYVIRPEVCKWFGCNGNHGKFNHSDKRLVNMLLEFFPNEVCLHAPNVEILDMQYQNQKHQIKN